MNRACNTLLNTLRNFHEMFLLFQESCPVEAVEAEVFTSNIRKLFFVFHNKGYIYIFPAFIFCQMLFDGYTKDIL